MRTLFLAASLALIASPAAWADPSSGPEEVGSTSMPPGQYYVTEQNSHKSYALTVTQKGNMILGPVPSGVIVKIKQVPTAEAQAEPSGAAAAGGVATGAAVDTAAPASGNNMQQDALKGLMQKGMQKGMTELMKHGGTKQIEKLIK